MKKASTHLTYFPEFAVFVEQVDQVLVRFATTPKEIKALMGQYCESLGKVAA